MRLHSLSFYERLTRTILWAFTVGLFLWVLNKNFVPGGTLQFTHAIEHSSQYVTSFAAKEKEKLVGQPNGDDTAREKYQILRADPLYIDVQVPRAFQKATVRVRYQNPSGQPILKLGVQQAGESYVFRDLAVTAPALDALDDTWDRMQDGDLVLWQRNRGLIAARAQEKERIQPVLDALAKGQAQRLRELDESVAAGEISAEDYSQQSEEVRQEGETRAAEIRKAITNVERPAARFSSVNSFLQSPPHPSTTLQYHYALPAFERVANYVPSRQRLVIDKSIRGKHELLTYLGKDEPLDFTFTARSINRHAGKDALRIEVWRGNEQLFSEGITELGSDDPTGVPSDAQTLTVRKNGLREGTYTLKIDTTDDVFLTRMETAQHLLMFSGNIYLTDNSEYANVLGAKKLDETILYTTSTAITAETSHEKGLQTLRVGNNTLTLRRKATPVTMYRLRDVTRIVSPVNDVLVRGNGYFAFSADQLFPLPLPYSAYADTMSLEGYDFVIGRLREPRRDGMWLVSEAVVESPELYMPDGRARFIIHYPELAENGRLLKIESVAFSFQKEPWRLGTILRKVRNIFTGKAKAAL